MKIIFILPVILFLLFPASVSAQEILQEPLCFAVRNEAPYKVYGNFGTDYYTAADGTRARHRSNFRLDEAGSTGEDGTPSDRAEFCSYGPFYPDRKLEIVLRTLVPIFNCKTRIDRGEIIIKGYRKPEGGAETWAECFE